MATAKWIREECETYEAEARERGWPKLEGPENGVRLALEIRRAAVAAFERYRDGELAEAPVAEWPAVERACAATLAWLTTHESVYFFVERRRFTPEDWLCAAMSAADAA